MKIICQVVTLVIVQTTKIFHQQIEVLILAIIYKSQIIHKYLQLYFASSDQKSIKQDWPYFILCCKLNTLLTYMSKELEHAEPAPQTLDKFEDCLPLIEKLSLKEKDSSKTEEKNLKLYSTKKISKPLTRKYKAGTTRKTDNKKMKVILLEKKVIELQSEIDKLNRKIQNCPSCQRTPGEKDPFLSSLNIYSDPSSDEIRRMANQTVKPNENAGCSMEFQNIDFFNMKGMYSKEIDEFSWVYLGTLMIAMGSCCTDFDGNINVFKVQKQSVDALRRQVEKCQDNISMDFFMSKQSLPESPINYDEIGFDPFINKLDQASQGLVLDTVKVESVDQFELLYDNKVTFRLKYEALIAAMEYIRQFCWISM